MVDYSGKSKESNVIVYRPLRRRHCPPRFRHRRRRQGYPRFVDGAMRCPPEDVGGIPGFCAFLEAMADPNHPEHEDRLDWHGGPFDPADLDAKRIDKALARLAARRKGAAKRA
jgi:hypothetical protein